MTQNGTPMPVQQVAIPNEAGLAYQQLCRELEPVNRMPGSIFQGMGNMGIMPNVAGAMPITGGAQPMLMPQMGIMPQMDLMGGLGMFGGIGIQQQMSNMEMMDNIEKMRELIANKRNTSVLELYRQMVKDAMEKYNIKEKQAKTFVNKTYQMYTGSTLRGDVRKHLDNWFEWTSSDSIIEEMGGVGKLIPWHSSVGWIAGIGAALAWGRRLMGK